MIRAVLYNDYKLGMQGSERIGCDIFNKCLISDGGFVDDNIKKLAGAEDLLLGINPLEDLPERGVTAETS